MITIIAPSRYKLNKRFLTQRADAYLQGYGKSERDNVNVVFVGKRKMLSIANTYKHENEALPVLTFAMNETTGEEHLIGEIFICYPQAVLLAAEREKRVDEMIAQLTEHGIDNLCKK